MRYLVLDHNLEVVETLTTQELQERLGDQSLKAFMMYNSLLNGNTVVEDSTEFNANNFKFICDSKKNKYFASREGRFYAIAKRTNKKRELTINYHHGEMRVKINNKYMNAARLIAMLFIPDYDENKTVLLIDQNKKVSADNLRIVKRTYSKERKNCRRRIGLFENNECISEYPSIKDAAIVLNYSYSTITHYLSSDSGLDLRYL